jgi:hypothetical protein
VVVLNHRGHEKTDEREAGWDERFQYFCCLVGASHLQRPAPGHRSQSWACGQVSVSPAGSGPNFALSTPILYHCDNPCIVILQKRMPDKKQEPKKPTDAHSFLAG